MAVGGWRSRHDCDLSPVIGFLKPLEPRWQKRNMDTTGMRETSYDSPVIQHNMRSTQAPLIRYQQNIIPTASVPPSSTGEADMSVLLGRISCGSHGFYQMGFHPRFVLCRALASILSTAYSRNLQLGLLLNIEGDGY